VPSDPEDTPLLYPEAKGVAAGATRAPRCPSHAQEVSSTVQTSIEYKERPDLSPSALCVPYSLPDPSKTSSCDGKSAGVVQNALEEVGFHSPWGLKSEAA